MTFNEDWEQAAADWIAWARAPGHDEYWRYRDAFFALLPPPGRATLDLGCGEGRLTRDLKARGYAVEAIDASPTLLRAAAEADPGGAYTLADAAELPFADGRFDLVVAYNVLMDVDDLEGAVREVARVLEPGGRLCLCVTHPVADAGAFESGERFVIDEAYLATRRFEGTFERDGLRVSLRGWAHPLERYFGALEASGLVVEALREPASPGPGRERWRRLPAFLMLRANAHHA